MADINKELSETEKYIRTHIHSVQKRMYILINELMRRCEVHDHSKLEDQELPGWEAMDAEPRYDYGSQEYFSKVDRYSWLLNRHYEHRDNKHHPEHFGQWWLMEMDLIDLMEMMCDWCAYKDSISTDLAFDTIEKQFERFKVPKIIQNIMINTIMRYFVDREGSTQDYEINPLLKQSQSELQLSEPEIIPEELEEMEDDQQFSSDIQKLRDFFSSGESSHNSNEKKQDSLTQSQESVPEGTDPHYTHCTKSKSSLKDVSEQMHQLQDWLDTRLKNSGIQIAPNRTE